MMHQVQTQHCHFPEQSFLYAYQHEQGTPYLPWHAMHQQPADMLCFWIIRLIRSRSTIEGGCVHCAFSFQGLEMFVLLHKDHHHCYMCALCVPV